MSQVRDFKIEPAVTDLPTPIPYLSFDQLQARLEATAVVKGLLGTAAMSVVYGASNTGKTFAVFDIGLHIALGWLWRGRRITQGAVLYIAGEGGHGIHNRAAAFRLRHGISEEVPFAVIASPIDLCSESAETGRLIATINEVAERFDFPLVLVIVDTLSRALAGGNENTSEDMGSYVKHVDRIRQETGAHVLSVHHTGKNQALGARGHSLLRAATDTEIEVERDEATGISTLRVTKQRDLPIDPEPIAFRLESVDLGRDTDGDLVTSCIIVDVDPGEANEAAKVRSIPLPNSAKVALSLLRKAIDEKGEIPPASNHIPTGTRAVSFELWRRYCYAGQISDGGKPDAKQKAFKRAAEKLVAVGAARVWVDWAWISA